jgi:hypothetical protein
MCVMHSTVDSESGIGNRLDGWPNRDLNVGAVISMAPEVKYTMSPGQPVH